LQARCVGFYTLHISMSNMFRRDIFDGMYIWNPMNGEVGTINYIVNTTQIKQMKQLWQCTGNWTLFGFWLGSKTMLRPSCPMTVCCAML
jgi:3',5'-cyclic AMP phosphodiesterase CpdA